MSEQQLQYGAHLSDHGGSRCSSAEAWVEVCDQTGSLIAVCGEHHDDHGHLCRHHPDYEPGEKNTGTKIETERQLKMASSETRTHCLHPVMMSAATPGRDQKWLASALVLHSTHLNFPL